MPKMPLSHLLKTQVRRFPLQCSPLFQGIKRKVNNRNPEEVRSSGGSKPSHVTSSQEPGAQSSGCATPSSRPSPPPCPPGPAQFLRSLSHPCFCLQVQCSPRCSLEGMIGLLPSPPQSLCAEAGFSVYYYCIPQEDTSCLPRLNNKPLSKN